MAGPTGPRRGVPAVRQAPSDRRSIGRPWCSPRTRDWLRTLVQTAGSFRTHRCPMATAARSRTLGGYARRVMTNANIDRWRRDRGRERLTADVPRRRIGRRGRRGVAERDARLRALQGLSSQERRVVVLRFLEEPQRGRYGQGAERAARDRQERDPSSHRQATREPGPGPDAGGESMNEAADLVEARAVLHAFDLGPLSSLDVDDLISSWPPPSSGGPRAALRCRAGRRPGRRRRHRPGAARGGGHPTPASTHSATPAPSPTASPTTVAERSTSSWARIASATSVHVVTKLGGDDLTLDVVVSKDGAIGTLTHAGKSSEYLGVDECPLRQGRRPGRQPPRREPGRRCPWAMGRHDGWADAQQIPGGLRLALSQSFYPSHGTTLSLGPTRTIDGVPTVALISRRRGRRGAGCRGGCAVPAGVRRVRPTTCFTRPSPTGTPPRPTPPPAPAAADVYKPFGLTQEFRHDWGLSSSSSRVSGWELTNSAVSAYIRWM